MNAPALALAGGEAAVPVLWVFRNVHGDWCAREEGGDTVGFASRDAALAFARKLGQAWGGYRLFLELKDGRFTQELLNPRGSLAAKIGG